MNQLLIALSFAAMAAQAQPGLAPPQLGFIAGTDRSLRPVLGLPGNLLLGSPAAEEVVAAAWSGSFGIVKTTSSLMAFDAKHMVASVNAVAGPALFAFLSNGSPAFALLPHTGNLYIWTGKAFDPVSFPADAPRSQTLAIAAPQPGRLSSVVERDDGLWLEQMLTSGGEVVRSALPGVQSPVLLQDDGTLLYTDHTALIIRDATGEERKIEIGVPIGAMHWMGSGWVHVIGANNRLQFAVRITVGSEKISQLPEVR